MFDRENLMFNGKKIEAGDQIQVGGVNDWLLVDQARCAEMFVLFADGSQQKIAMPLNYLSVTGHLSKNDELAAAKEKMDKAYRDLLSVAGNGNASAESKYEKADDWYQKRKNYESEEMREDIRKKRFELESKHQGEPC